MATLFLAYPPPQQQRIPSSPPPISSTSVASCDLNPLRGEGVPQIRFSLSSPGQGGSARAAWSSTPQRLQKFKCGREYFQVSSSRNFLRTGLHLKPSPPSAAAAYGVGIVRMSAESAKKKSGFDASLPIEFKNGEDPPTVVSAPNRRIVAIGDLHGDFERTQWALQLAGVLSKDGQHRWTGGTTVVVQVGDVLDRGEDEIAILSLLAWLGQEARSKGGAVFQVLGNHETMNVAGDFRYVAPGGFQEAEAFAEYCEEEHGGNWEAAFLDWHAASREKKSGGLDFTGWLPIFNSLRMHKGVAARSMLFNVGGPVAKELARHGVALKVNDWLFAHGGVLPHHVDYGLERMNNEVSLWMKNANNKWGRPSQMPFIAVRGFDSIVWSRIYSKENFEKPEEKIQACAILSAALVATNSRGLVVGHTPQTIGANCKCDGRIWRIDVGMSSGVLHALPEVHITCFHHLDSQPGQVLEITDNEVRILRMAEEFLQDDDESIEGWLSGMRVQNISI